MKLRNKKTGEIEPYIELIINQSFGRTKEYSTLKEFCEEWEDYTPKEPLIKDEKIRKIVKAWADQNNIKEVDYLIIGTGVSLFVYDDIEINFTFQVEGVRDDKRYTIAELCGEEE